MSIFKACFTKQSKFTVQYSARTTLARCPPTGRTSDPEDPNKQVWKSQFSCGDQEDRSRIPFWNRGFAACVQCGEWNIWRFEEKAGIREDVKVFSCMTKGCQWETSFMYDDGCNGCVHFEARGWPRGILHYPVAFIMMWADKHKLGSKVKHIIFLNKIDGDMLLQYAKNGKLRNALQVDKKTCAKIKVILNDRFGALLYHQDIFKTLTSNSL